MMTPDETDRLARMTAALRPGWPLASLRTGLASFAHAHPHRSYADTAHALVAIALDPATKNPGRLAENGPWWQARPGTEPDRPVTRGTDCTICPRCGEAHTPAVVHECWRPPDPAHRATLVAQARDAIAAKPPDDQARRERATAGRGAA